MAGVVMLDGREVGERGRARPDKRVAYRLMRVVKLCILLTWDMLASSRGSCSRVCM